MKKTQKEVNYQLAFEKLKEGLIEAEWRKNDRATEPDPAIRYVIAYGRLKAHVKFFLKELEAEDLYCQLRKSEIL